MRKQECFRRSNWDFHSRMTSWTEFRFFKEHKVKENSKSLENAELTGGHEKLRNNFNLSQLSDSSLVSDPSLTFFHGSLCLNTANTLLFIIYLNQSRSSSSSSSNNGGGTARGGGESCVREKQVHLKLECFVLVAPWLGKQQCANHDYT